MLRNLNMRVVDSANLGLRQQTQLIVYQQRFSCIICLQSCYWWEHLKSDENYSLIIRTWNTHLVDTYILFFFPPLIFREEEKKSSFPNLKYRLSLKEYFEIRFYKYFIKDRLKFCFYCCSFALFCLTISTNITDPTFCILLLVFKTVVQWLGLCFWSFFFFLIKG